ncbi:MAG: hypothetical protein NC310_09105 [Roseburia sp.]|nr:hypothetical protein [Roseburia sp.]
MEVSIWITIISDVVCALIGVIGGVIGKTYYYKKKNKKIIKQKQIGGDSSQQIQIGDIKNGR